MLQRFVQSKPGDLAPQALIFLFSYAVLLFFTVSPTVYAGDSSLFSSASYFMGTAHHPAYPLLVQFGKAFTFVPIGNIAYKTNLMAAVFGALAAVFAYQSSVCLSQDRFSSLLAPLAVISSPMFILESSKVEAYSFNAFLVMIIFWLGAEALKKDTYSFRILLLISFLIGLGMGNHHSIGFMAPLVIVLFLLKRDTIPYRAIPLCFIFFCVGISIYAYLFLRTKAGTIIDYSKVFSFQDLIVVFFRKGYKADSIQAISSVVSSGSGWYYAVKNIMELLYRELNPVILFLVPAVFLRLRSEWRKIIYITAALILWLPLAKISMSSSAMTSYQTSLVSPYFLPLIPATATIAAYGLSALRRGPLKSFSIISSGAIASLLIFQAVYLPIAVQKSSLSDYYIAQGWVKDTSKVLKPKSFYLAFGDNAAFLAFYGFGVERLRDDVLVLNSLPKSNIFGVAISPKWKYEKMYPDFYASSESHVRDLMPLAKTGRLYCSDIGSLGEDIEKHFHVQPFVLSAKMLSEEPGPEYGEEYKEAFQKIDYLPVFLGHKHDLLTNEINWNYAKTTWRQARLLASEDDSEYDYYYRLAYALADGELKYSILLDYLKFITYKGGEETGREFIRTLRTTAEDQDSLKILDRLEASYNKMLSNTVAPSDPLKDDKSNENLL